MTTGFLPYGRQTIDQADIDAVVAVLQSDWLTTGPAVERFEVDLPDLAPGPHVVAVRATDASGNTVTAEVEHSPRR